MILELPLKRFGRFRKNAPLGRGVMVFGSGMSRSGRLDLDVTAHVGEFAATTLLGQLLRSPLRLIQPVGVGLLIRANDFLQRRLLYLNLGGSIRNPTVRPRAAEALQQEAVLFFLDSAGLFQTR